MPITRPINRTNKAAGEFFLNFLPCRICRAYFHAELFFRESSIFLRFSCFKQSLQATFRTCLQSICIFCWLDVLYTNPTIALVRFRCSVAAAWEEWC
jgi:hypothetical protein